MNEDSKNFSITVTDAKDLSYVTFTIRSAAIMYPWRVKETDPDDRARSIKEGVQAVKLRMIEAIINAKETYSP